MILYVETTSGSTFSINMHPWDTVLDTKKKIEKSQGIAVSSQELYIKGMRLAIDDMHLITCNIVNNSRLLLVLRDEYNYQVLPRTEKSPAPSNYITNIKDSPGKNQGWPVTATTNNRQMLHRTGRSQVPPSNALLADLLSKDWSNDVQMLHQRERSQVPLSNELAALLSKDWSNDVQMLHQTEHSQEPPSNALLADLLSKDWSNDVQMLHRTGRSQVPPSNELAALLSKDWSNDVQMLHQRERSQVPPSNELAALLSKDWSNDVQMLHQREQSPLNSCTIDEILQLVPHMPVTVEDIRKLQRNVNIQESLGRNGNNQDLLRRESSHPSNTFGDFSFGEDRFLSAERITNSQYSPARTTEEIINRDQVFQTEQSMIPSNTFGDFSFGEDRPLSSEHFTNIRSYLPARTTGEIINENQVFQTEQFTVPSNPFGDFSFGVDRPLSTEDYTNIQSYLPAKLRVMVLPYSHENKPVRKFPVKVNASEKVVELRKKLERIRQRSSLDLPEEGYHLINKQRVLDEEQSFRWNGVAHGDTIEIFPVYIPRETRRRGGLERTFGI